MEAAELAAIEALSDPRLGPVGRDELASELADRFIESAVDLESLALAEPAQLDAARRGRVIEWAAETLTDGDVLDAFAIHCRDLEDVELLRVEPTRLDVAWRRERSAVELRAGFLFCERLAGAEPEPTLLIGDLGTANVERFVDDESLRSRIALYDLARLEKINAVRSSVFVYFEWFLRDVYGVKLLQASGFTQGLINRGVISLGMG
jgi:hypothetical protein